MRAKHAARRLERSTQSDHGRDSHSSRPREEDWHLRPGVQRRLPRGIARTKSFARFFAKCVERENRNCVVWRKRLNEIGYLTHIFRRKNDKPFIASKTPDLHDLHYTETVSTQSKCPFPPPAGVLDKSGKA